MIECWICGHVVTVYQNSRKTSVNFLKMTTHIWIIQLKRFAISCFYYGLIEFIPWYESINVHQTTVSSVFLLKFIANYGLCQMPLLACGFLEVVFYATLRHINSMSLADHALHIYLAGQLMDKHGRMLRLILRST